jgi:hypothetical protein
MVRMKYLVSDTITEFKSYWVEAESEGAAQELVDQHATYDLQGYIGRLEAALKNLLQAQRNGDFQDLDNAMFEAEQVFLNGSPLLELVDRGITDRFQQIEGSR